MPVGPEERQTTQSTVVPPSPQEPSSTRKSFPKIPKGIVIVLAFVSLIGILFLVIVKSGLSVQQFSIKLPNWTGKQETSKPEAEQIALEQKSTEATQALLTKEEQDELAKPFQITIPRQLSNDEEEILKKQVSFPASLAEKPKLRIWKKEEFEKMIASEQKGRRIRLGWWYVRSLTKTFEEYYPAAAKAFEEGDYVLARELFIKSLSFPTYQNDPKVHRAVALVMLRPYINDVIGKIALLNQYLLSQSLITEVHTLFTSYQALFSVLELQEWERALQLIREIKKQISDFESKPQNAQVNYPVAFAEIDPEIQAALQNEAAPKPEGAVSLKALSIDLDLKEKVVRQNTEEELLKVQRQYEEASHLLADGNWQAAREKLRAIEFPPELANEAKKKLALMDQANALREAKGKKT